MSVIIQPFRLAHKAYSQMLQESDNHNQSQRPIPERTLQEYARPTLRTFGAVGALTQSGTMNGVEMTMMNGECSLGQMNMC